ncbi:MAG: metal-dependent hydrolase [Methanosarcina sp.]
MVNSLSHLGFGLLIALALGFKGKKRNSLAFLAILPDLDFIPYLIFALVSDSVSHETRNQLFYLFGHREFMHSILFIVLVTVFLWVKTKDLLFALAGFAAIFSHVYLDYATSWKMRPFYPFSTETSTMGAVYFFDPLANILPLIPIFIVLIGYLKSKGKLKGKFENLCAFASKNNKKLSRALIVILVFWLALLPVAKIFLVNYVSQLEGNRISYQDTYPSTPGNFITAYSYNATHYKIMEVSYWSGIEKSDYIKKINTSSITENPSDIISYVERAGKLYSTALPQDVDFPTYSVFGNNSSVTVSITDARDPYVKYWAYFDTAYRFVFDTKSEEYTAYASIRGTEEQKLPENYFGET